MTHPIRALGVAILALLLAACASTAPGPREQSAIPTPVPAAPAASASAPEAAGDESGQGLQPHAIMEPSHRVREPKRAVASLEDHIWYWTCDRGSPHQQYMQFLSDGTVRYDYQQGSDPSRFTYHNAAWYIEDERLFIDYNQGFAIDEFPLERREGDLWVGVPAKTRHCPEVVMRVHRG